MNHTKKYRSNLYPFKYKQTNFKSISSKKLKYKPKSSKKNKKYKKIKHIKKLKKSKNPKKLSNNNINWWKIDNWKELSNPLIEKNRNIFIYKPTSTIWKADNYYDYHPDDI